MKFLILLPLISCAENKKEIAAPSEETATTSKTITNAEPEPIVASYDKGLDLILIGDDTIDDEARSFSTTYFYAPDIKKYYSGSLEITNNITYDPSLAIPDKIWDQELLYTNISLLYVGSTDLTNRIYIDPTTEETKVLKLRPINMPNEELEIFYAAPYHVRDSHASIEVFLTNKNHELFRLYYFRTILTSNTNVINWVMEQHSNYITTMSNEHERSR